MLIRGRVHWTLTLTSSYSKVFETLHYIFDRAHEYYKSPFLKSTFWRAFLKTSVFVAENVVYVWTGGANGKKSLHFRKYPDTCGRGLSLTNFV